MLTPMPWMKIRTPWMKSLSPKPSSFPDLPEKEHIRHEHKRILAEKTNHDIC